MKEAIYAFGVGCLALCLAIGNARANVIVSGTRVIFPAKEREITVRLTNNGNKPSLVQTWIDDGDPRATPDKVKTPFLITPPLFRMEPNRDQSLRILSTATDLPTDRESLFYLNVLDIPPKAGPAEGKNMLQFAIRTRLKLFYRPVNLAGNPIKAPEELTWKVVSEGQRYAVEVHNPTSYHISLSEVKLGNEGQQYAADVDISSMVGPFGILRLPLKELKSIPAPGMPVDYAIVNDYGAVSRFKGAIVP